MCMTLGLVFLFQMIQVYLEKFILYAAMATICCKDKKLYQIIAKNLNAHRRRNSKTALMFTFCICFLMYSSSCFMLVEDIVSQTFAYTLGADLVAVDPIWKLGLANQKAYLDEVSISAFLEEQQLIDEPIIAYSYSTQNLQELLMDMGYSQIQFFVNDATDFT